MVVAMRNIQAAVAVRQPVSVRWLLEWAFGVEKAQVDFDELGVAPGGIDTVWLLMQRGQLGCKIDGGRQGGGAQSADDADIVAAVVASLPVEQGGRSMAVRIAQLARAGMVPDWYPNAVPRFEPLEWRHNQHGSTAGTVDARDLRFSGFGRFPIKASRCCPVRVVPSVQQIGAARRFWIDWMKALLHIQHELRIIGLSRWDVTDELPPFRPWAESKKPID